MSLMNTDFVTFPFPWPLIMKPCFTLPAKLQSLLFSTSAKIYVARDKGRVIHTQISAKDPQIKKLRILPT